MWKGVLMELYEVYFEFPKRWTENSININNDRIRNKTPKMSLIV